MAAEVKIVFPADLGLSNEQIEQLKSNFMDSLVDTLKATERQSETAKKAVLKSEAVTESKVTTVDVS